MRAMKNSSPTTEGMSLGGGPFLLSWGLVSMVLCSAFLPAQVLARFPGQSRFWLAPRTGLKALLLKIAGPHLSRPLPQGVSQDSCGLDDDIHHSGLTVSWASSTNA